MSADENRISDAAQQRVDDSTHSLKGAGLAEDSTNLVKQVASGEWTQGLVSAVSAGFEIKDFLKDPLAKLVSMGLGWVIEFFEPLNNILDGLIGDDQQIAVAAETWNGISSELAGVAEDLDAAYRADTAHWSGPAVEQYKIFCADRVDLYKAASGAAAATAGTIGQCKSILVMVREIVRNLITDAIGKVVSIVCRYPPPTTPAATPEVTTTVAQYANKITEWVKKLQVAFANARELLKEGGNLYRSIRGCMEMAANSARYGAKYGGKIKWLTPVAKTLPIGDAFKAAGKGIPGGLLEDFVIGGTKAGAEIHKDDDDHH